MKITNIIQYMIPSKIYANYKFYRRYKRFINYKNPLLMDEKLSILAASYYKNREITICSDKYEVRKYIERKGLENILNKLYGVYNNVDELKWDNIPNRCAIKCTHGCGYNIIIGNKEKVDRGDVIKQLSDWMEENYAFYFGEKHYKNIIPRIIVEKYLENSEGKLPEDFKFFVSKGNVIGCMIALGREEKLERIFVNNDFEDMHFINEYTGSNHYELKPMLWDDMLKIASKLGEDFPFVRVDLYYVNNQIVFGELTFTPNGCIHEQFSLEGQKWIGKQISL